MVSVDHGVTAILAWSTWRRWHQAWARYHHYRRRADQTPAPPPESPAAGAGPEAPLIAQVWARLTPLLPDSIRTGRPYAYDRRVVLEAIIYVMVSGCGWHALPARFPSWQTVYSQFRQWQKLGIWDTIWSLGTQSIVKQELQL